MRCFSIVSKECIYDNKHINGNNHNFFYQNRSISEETTSTKSATRGARIPPILAIQEQEPIPEFLTTVGNNSAEYW